MNKIVYAGRTFTDDNIISGSCYLAQSLLSSALEIDTFDFSVSYDDPALKDYLLDAPLLYYQDDKLVGTYFVQEIDRTSRLNYDFSCISVVGLLDKAEHYGGIYTGQTVADVAQDICKGFAISVAKNVAKIKLYGWLPIASARENLAQVLFAISATIRVAGDGTIMLQGLDDTTKSDVGADRMSIDSSVQYDAPVTRVTVLEHQYVRDVEEKKLFEGVTSANDRITFDQPMHSLTASGFSVLQAGDNYAIVSAGSGTLTGKTYAHTTREVIGSAATLRAALNVENTIRVEDATLISLANSRAVADRLAEYYTHTEHIVSNIDYQIEQAGDVISMIHPYDGKSVQSCLESVDITLSANARASTTSLVGYLPPDITQIEYYDTFVVLTGSGTWVAPDKIRNLRAVLIGGSQGGFSGLRGKNASSSTGGDGGAGGIGGAGGKIYQTEISLEQNRSFSYNCGAPGQGGDYSPDISNAGTFGTDTIFGSFSSAQGSASDTGFLNLINNKIYGKRGEKGLNGGRGGDGGKGTYEDNTSAQKGEDVGAYKGGEPGDDRGSSMYKQFAGGSGGSGAAYGQNGRPGNRGQANTALSEGGDGVNGANASPPNAVPQDGNGGFGGNGGGGGSGGGEAYVGRTGSDGYPKPQKGDPGLGGAGSRGGIGSYGCIILFYSAPVEVI